MVRRTSSSCWPGNVRELENLVERAVTLSYDSKLKLDMYLPQNNGAPLERLPEPQILDDHLFRVMRKNLPELFAASLGSGAHLARNERPLPLDDVTREHILSALEYSRGKVHSRGGAGELLGINPDTLRKRMKKIGIS